MSREQEQQELSRIRQIERGVRYRSLLCATSIFAAVGLRLNEDAHPNETNIDNLAEPILGVVGMAGLLANLYYWRKKISRADLDRLRKAEREEKCIKFCPFARACLLKANVHTGGLATPVTGVTTREDLSKLRDAAPPPLAAIELGEAALVIDNCLTGPLITKSILGNTTINCGGLDAIHHGPQMSDLAAAK